MAGPKYNTKAPWAASCSCHRPPRPYLHDLSLYPSVFAQSEQSTHSHPSTTGRLPRVFLTQLRFLVYCTPHGRNSLVESSLGSFPVVP